MTFLSLKRLRGQDLLFVTQVGEVWKRKHDFDLAIDQIPRPASEACSKQLVRTFMVRLVTVQRCLTTQTENFIQTLESNQLQG